MIAIEVAREQVERFITDTDEARQLSERCRDYFDHKQWTEKEAAKLEARNQAPIVVNRLRPKIKGLCGLYDMRETEAKAYPRTKKHEKSAHAITDALRYVADNNNFTEMRLDVAEDTFVEGYGGVMVNVKNRGNDIEILLEHLPWDRIYYDPHSRKKCFTDATYIGYYLWLYEDQAQALADSLGWGGDVKDLISDTDVLDETTEDRPRWVDTDRKRIRIAVHFSQAANKWEMAIFTGNTFLMDPQESPYHDEDGQPCCPIELVSFNVDRNNNRYGEAAGFLDQQDEINHRRSKALHLLNQRQTHGREGAVADVAKLKREMSKPDGHVEWNGNEFGKDFGVIPTGDMLRGQFELYQDAKAEMDAVSFNAQLSGERQEGDLSGVAIGKLQAAGTIELNQDYSRLAGWEKRVYRQIWGRIKEFWTEEKWIRVTDDQDSLRWVGLNGPLTMREQLEEWINDESLPIPDRRKYAAVYTQAIKAEAQMEDPAVMQQASDFLETVVSSKNPVPEIDVDIIIDQSYASSNTQEEQFNLLAKFATSGDVDIIELIELSQLRGKDELIEKIEQRRQQAAQAQGQVAQIEAKQAEAALMETAARADKTQAEAAQTKIENEALMSNSSTSETAMDSLKKAADAEKARAEAFQKTLENHLLVTNPEKVTQVSV